MVQLKNPPTNPDFLDSTLCCYSIQVFLHLPILYQLPDSFKRRDPQVFALVCESIRTKVQDESYVKEEIDALATGEMEIVIKRYWEPLQPNEFPVARFNQRTLDPVLASDKRWEFGKGHEGMTHLLEGLFRFKSCPEEFRKTPHETCEKMSDNLNWIMEQRHRRKVASSFSIRAPYNFRIDFGFSDFRLGAQKDSFSFVLHCGGNALEFLDNFWIQKKTFDNYRKDTYYKILDNFLLNLSSYYCFSYAP